MLKKISITLLSLFLMSGNITTVHAQMMMGANPSISVNPTQIQQQLQEEAEGKKLFETLQNDQTTCAKLTESDFEKIGEYSMSQMTGNNTAAHIVMNNHIQQMRGDTGEEQAHIQIGRSLTGCLASSGVNNTVRNGFMMGGNGFGGIHTTFEQQFSGFGVLAIITHIFIVADLILFGLWLLRQLRKK